MNKDEFMRLWSDEKQYRTVVITSQSQGNLTIIINFPPDKTAIGKINLFPDSMLDDPF